jgi:hypothetical protein
MTITNLGSFEDPNIPPAPAEEIQEAPVATEIPAEQPEVPTGQEQPAAIEQENEAPVVEVPPVVENTPSFEEQFRTVLGMSPSELEVQLKELEALKQRPMLDDKELLPDDDFLKDFIRAYKRGGNKVAGEYLLAATADYSAMSAEQILRQDVQRRNAGASEAILNAEYKKELRQLGWSEDMEQGSEEEKLFNEYLSFKANQLRGRFSEEAKKFQIPERKEPEQAQANDSDTQRLIESYKSEFMSSSPVRALLQAKTVNVGGFALAVEPQSIADLILDATGTKLSGLFTNPDGSQNIEKMLKWYSLASDPDKAISLASNAAVAKAKAEWLAGLKNPSVEPVNKPPTNGVHVRLIGQ